MMLAADVYDVSPRASAVAMLAEHGVDPWVVDFGAPEHDEGGLQRTLTDHVVAVSDAVDRVRARPGRDVHLGGYSQGGMFCYQTAAYRRSEGLASLITFGSPVDTRGALPFGIPEELAVRGAGLLADDVLAGYALPAWASRLGFRLLDPVKSLRQQIDFVLALHDRDALLPRERQRQFLEQRGWVAWPGPALADFISQFVAHNRMLSGGFVIDDRLVTLADLTLPVLTVVGEVDEIAPPRAVRAVRRAAPRADIHELTLRAGHFGLVVGSTASRTTWPTVAGWTHWRDERTALPDEIRRVDADEPDPEPAVATRVGVGLELAAASGSASRAPCSAPRARGASLSRQLTDEAIAPAAAPRAAGARPADDAHLRRAAARRAGSQRARRRSLSLRGPRPHARRRQGAHRQRRARAAVARRASGGARRRAHEHAPERARRRRRAEPDRRRRRPAAPRRRHGPRARARPVRARHRRSGARAGRRYDGGASRCSCSAAARRGASSAPASWTWSGSIPPPSPPPAWYRPNPGLAGDLAFVLFTGEGARTHVNRITNGRWSLSAFGTASSAALSPSTPSTRSRRSTTPRRCS